MAMLTREMILGAVDLPREAVVVPEWGGEVWVRGLSGAERDAYEASVLEMKGRGYTIRLENARAKLASLAMCDEQGKRLFLDADVHALGGKSAAALNRVFEVASRLSGLGERDIEELAKN